MYNTVPTAPNLRLSADSSYELEAKLRALDITVPNESSKHNKNYREQYMIAKFIATFARTNLLTYSIELLHSDKPDFLLNCAGSEVGIECVEANTSDQYHILDIHNKQYPQNAYFRQRFIAGVQLYALDEKHEIENETGSE